MTSRRGREEHIPEGIDPRAKGVADSIYFELQNFLIAIPVFIVCLGIALTIDVTVTSVLMVAFGAAIAFAVLRWIVEWLHRELRRRDAQDRSATD